jgi:hypothetical protein
VLLPSDLARDRGLQEKLLRDAPCTLERLGVKVEVATIRVSKCLDAFVRHPGHVTRDKCLVSFKRLQTLLERCPRSVVFPQWCFPESS